MTCRHTVVDERLIRALRIPRRDRIRADLQLQCRRHAIARQIFVVDRVLTVRVEIDEARRHNQPFDIDGIAGRGNSGGYGNDPPAFDAHCAYGVEVRFRVEHSTADEHDVER